MPGFDAALTGLANLCRSGALMTSLVDCYRAGYDRPGPAGPRARHAVAGPG